MKKYVAIAGFLLLTMLLTAAWFQPQSNESTPEDEPDWTSEVEGEPEVAVLAGGCFWCIEAVYEGRKGIASAISGYAGGDSSTATYDQVSTGETAHREAVKVKYYPSVVSYSEILDMYWRSIDPTDPNGQFTDRGPHYTTAIYPRNNEQYRIAVESRENLSESGKFEKSVVTEIENFTTFFRAEDKHQNYSRKRTASYKTYERLSGRKGFLDRVWN